MPLLSSPRAIEQGLTRVAEPLGISVMEAAAGIKAIGDHQMADMLHTLYDRERLRPAGLRAVRLWRRGANALPRVWRRAKLGVRSIVVPTTATVHSAYGAVASDVHRFLAATESSATSQWCARVTRIEQVLDLSARW
ncbi:MAG: hypothetical protein LC797_03560 [Chloroflexi bacterium]|nr:hypothetical protein [Chloroflexota bacterium]